jgi:hypothetical protein
VQCYGEVLGRGQAGDDLDALLREQLKQVLGRLSLRALLLSFSRYGPAAPSPTEPSPGAVREPRIARTFS